MSQEHLYHRHDNQTVLSDGTNMVFIVSALEDPDRDPEFQDRVVAETRAQLAAKEPRQTTVT